MASAPMTALELVSRAQLLYRNPKTKSRLFSVGILHELHEMWSSTGRWSYLRVLWVVGHQ